MPTKTAVGMSGGLDSVYVLWKLLSTTDDEVTAVHFDQTYVSDNKRSYQPELSVYQKRTISEIVFWLKSNVRDFTFETRIVKNISSDQSFMVYFIDNLAPSVSDGTYDRICFGIGPRWENFPNISRTCPDGTVTNYDNRKTSTVYLNAMTRNGLDTEKFWVPIREWNANTFKIISELPSALYDLTYSCIKPSIDSDGNYIVCGECQKCHIRGIAKHKISEGVITANSFGTWLCSQDDITYTNSDNVSVTTSLSALTSGHGKEFNAFYSVGGIWEV